MVPYAYNPSYSGGRDRKIAVGSQHKMRSHLKEQAECDGMHL
jgi:hypothetical protein